MIQILVSDEGQKMDPLVTLYYSAPVCAFTNFMIAFYTELRGFNWSVVGETGVGVLVANAAVGFMLNVSIFALVWYPFPFFLSFFFLLLWISREVSANGMYRLGKLPG